MTISHFIVNSVLVLILGGCSAIGVTSVPVSIATQLSQPSPYMEKSEILPTITARTSSTPLLSPTLNQTQVVFDQAIYDATQFVVQTKVARFPRVCNGGYSRPRFSPNDLWMEELCYSEEDQELVLTLSNSETQALWKLLYHDYLPPMSFVPDGGMSVVHWSKDERYAYFFSFLGGDGGECFYHGGDRGSGVFRLDLQSGQTTTILPPNNDFWWYGFSFSPTDRRLVYGARARDLKILDITTGQSIDITSGGNVDETGGFLWSADGMKLVYSALARDEQGERESYSLHLVDTQSGNEYILIESPENCFEAKSWTATDILTIESYDKNYDRTLIEYDLDSNSIISESTATPHP